ncbi:unnamed protein product [Gongylonema pulchrum]|uniref:Copine domain-containing protein n=1 Tax=Gongylonema pulchrum TaxID=637853 RepID=A0A183EXK4_9BILA|nr:unnamed protein product [Gongylonema pulchrum]
MKPVAVLGAIQSLEVFVPKLFLCLRQIYFLLLSMKVVCRNTQFRRFAPVQ